MKEGKSMEKAYRFVKASERLPEGKGEYFVYMIHDNDLPDDGKTKCYTVFDGSVWDAAEGWNIIEWLEEIPKDERCDAMGHYGGEKPEGICPKCGKPWKSPESGEQDELKKENEKLRKAAMALLYFIDVDGGPVDGFRFRELALELRKALST